MTVKESFDVAGLATTWGDPAARSHIATTDAVVVGRLRAAGATILGKTNVPLGIADFQSFNAVYGQTNNPWDTGRTPGGSSGGAAVAIASGLSALEMGSDLGGSIRNPAHYCGVYAHKPTWGVVPFRSQSGPGAASVPQVLDMAVPGPLARSAGDLALAMQVTAGPDDLAATAWRLQLPAPRARTLQGLRVALWPDESLAPVETEISDRVARLGDELARCGATVSDAARPACAAEELWQTYRALVLALTAARDADAGHQSWLALHLRRGQLRLQWQQFFREWDVLVTPVASTVAFEHDHGPAMSRTLQVNGASRSYWEHVFWPGLATLAYLPATVFPTGVSDGGLPIGLQAIGAESADYTTIEFARLVAREFGGFSPPAGFP
jgi:amidase